MKKGKNNFKKGNFINQTFGENMEYVTIYDDNGITLLFAVDNRVIINNFNNTKEIIEKYIDTYIENEFVNALLAEKELGIDDEDF